MPPALFWCTSTCVKGQVARLFSYCSAAGSSGLVLGSLGPLGSEQDERCVSVSYSVCSGQLQPV